MILIAAGSAIVWHYGWNFTKQTVLLGYTVVHPYKPLTPQRTYKELWPNLPETVFSTAYGEFTYKVTRTIIVPKTEVNNIVQENYETLTLTTCYPFYYFGHEPKGYIVYT